MKKPGAVSLALFLAVACTGEGAASVTGDGSTEGSGDVDGSQSTSEGTGTSADEDTSSSGDGDGDSSSGGDGDGGATTSDTGSDGTSSGDGDSTTGGDGDGDGCVDLTGEDFGPCDAIIGYAFVNGGCSALSGCDCGDHCDDVFESMEACTEGCAALGECDTSAFLGYGLARDGWGEGTFCDEHTYCVPAGAVPVLEAGLDGVMCGSTSGAWCDQGHTECFLWAVGDTPSGLVDLLCEVSLWHAPKPELYCAVYGG